MNIKQNCKKPNVLVLLTDQQRYDTIGVAGYSHMITPNLDYLASSGCLYTNAHSSNPVCMPARHDLLTGLPGRAHGYFTNNRQPIKDYSLPTLPRIFQENGYRTVAVGKMHFFPRRMHHGFGDMFLMEEIPDCRQNDQYATYLKEQGLEHIQNLHGIRPHIYHIPQNSQMDEAHHGTNWVADKMIEWLQQNKEEPFFMMGGWISPHPPCALPKEYRGLYSGQEIPEHVPLSRNCLFGKEENEWYGDIDSEQEKRSIREEYYSSITMVDKHIGRVLNYLEESGILDNTLIIFTSDHGEMLQDKGFYCKMLPYEGAVRIPFIIRYPERFNKGVKNDKFVSLLDIMPTCLDVCGLEYNGGKYELEGESLCSESAKKHRINQVSSCGVGADRWVMNRNKRYKYIYWYNRGYEELFDMQNDPGELVNLMETENYPESEYIKLRDGVIDYEKQWGPDGVIVNGDFVKYDQAEYLMGVANSKFPFFCNKQFQRFNDSSSQEKEQRFIQEIKHALEGRDLPVNDIYNHPAWKKDFSDNWNSFGETQDIMDLLFEK